MPRQANGNYIAPANTAAVSGTAISSAAFNTLETDIGTEITNSLDRLGRSAMQAALPMGGNKVTGAADPTLSTDLATKNYVDTATAAFFSTGDGKLSLKNVADSGWILCDDGTFGSPSSGASSLASATTQALFTLFYNNLTDAGAPLLTSGGGATTRAAQTNAATAWAANCRMTLTKQLGRAIAIAGAGSGLTARVLGTSLGEESHVLAAAEIPTITAAGSGSASVTSTVNLPTNLTNGLYLAYNGSPSYGAYSPAGNPSTAITIGPVTSTGSASVTTTSNNTGGASPAAHNTMQPTTFWNVMVKL